MTPMRIVAMLLCVGLSIPTLCYAGIKRVETERKVVALTFDDGPNPPFTEELLDVLASKNVHATFFLIGIQIEAHPETARKILSAGHEVGGHSYDWTSLAFKSRKTFTAKLDAMEQSFAGIGVTNLVLFRPPNGILSPGQEGILGSRGLVHVSADVIAGDWKDIGADVIQRRVVNKVQPGSIIVLHDGGGNRAATVAAVPQIIDELRKQGYSFLTVSEVLVAEQNHFTKEHTE